MRTMRGGTRGWLVRVALFAIAGTTFGGDATVEVTGRVLLESGRPLPEAKIALIPLQEPRIEARQEFAGDPTGPITGAVSAVDGRFRLKVAKIGIYRVRIQAAGLVAMDFDLTPLIENRELPDVTLKADTGLSVRIEGRAQYPGDELRIRAEHPTDRFRAEPRWKPSAQTVIVQGDEPVRISKATGQSVILSLAAGGLAPQRRDSVRGNAAQLKPVPGQEYPLLVVNADGTPAADVSIFAERIGLEIARTAADGTATIRLDPADPLRIEALAADGRALTIDLTAVDPQGERRIRTLRLPEVRYVPGKVLDRQTRKGIPSGIVWDKRAPLSAVAMDLEGGFVYVASEGRGLELTAAAPGYLNADAIGFSLTDDGRPGPTFALRRAASVSGKVLDENGKPVVGAEIVASVKAARGGFRIEIGGESGNRTATSGAEGNFRLDALQPDTRLELGVLAKGFAPSKQIVEPLQPGAATSDIVVRLARGGTVVGKIVDGEGVGIGSAGLVLSPSKPAGPGGMMMIDADEISTPIDSVSAADGTFRMRGIPEGLYDLSVRSSGFAVERRAGISVAAEEIVVDPIELRPGETLKGQVTDPAGAPIEGVEVFVAGSSGPTIILGGPGSGEERIADAVTDVGGWFSLRDLAPGRPVDLNFERSAYIRQRAKSIGVPQLEPLLVKMKAATDVRGVVLDERDEPIAGAAVDLLRTKTIEMGNMVMQTMMMENTQTDGSGRFVFRDQEPGGITLKARAPRYQEAERSDITIPEGKALEDLVLPLIPGAIVEGRVLTPDGRPAIGAVVNRVGEGGGPLVMVMGGERTDGNGYFRLEGLEADRVSIAATHDDYPRVVKDLELKLGINGVDLRFEGGQSVRGRIVNQEGKPIASAAVRLNAARAFGAGPSTVSGSDGRFEFGGVHDGSYQLEVDADLYAGTESDLDVTVEGTPVEGLEVRLTRGGAIYGTLSGLEPTQFNEVSVAPDAFGFHSTPVNSAGSYRLDRLKPGEYEVVANYAPTGRQAKGKVRLDLGVEEIRLDLRFEAGISLSGRVSEDGEPVLGATIYAHQQEGLHNSWSQTDRAGAFLLEGLEPGRYKVQVQHWDSGMNHSEEFDLTTSREVEIRVPTGVLEGRIVDAADRQPLPGVTVSLDPQGESQTFTAQRVATTDVDGRFVLQNIGDGSWKISAERQGYASVRRDLEVNLAKSTDSLRFSMEPTDGLNLKVSLPSGGVPDEVTLAVLNAAGESIVEGRYPTGEAGSVRLSTVPTGRWSVVASAGGSAATHVEVLSPGADIGIALQPATRVTLRIPELENGSGFAKVRCYYRDGTPFYGLSWGGHSTTEFAVQQGRVDFAALPPGQWRFVVRDPAGREWEGTATSRVGAAAELILE